MVVRVGVRVPRERMLRIDFPNFWIAAQFTGSGFDALWIVLYYLMSAVTDAGSVSFIPLIRLCLLLRPAIYEESAEGRENVEHMGIR